MNQTGVVTEGNVVGQQAVSQAAPQQAVSQVAVQQAAPQAMQVAAPPKKQDTEATKKMKGNFEFFGLGTLLYACFYAFCMFKNGSGVTFPFFIVGSLLFLCFSLAKLEISLQKGSAFYMISMVLLAVSAFCTDDYTIISLNKTGIFLLMMSLLLNQFFKTADWKLGKYFAAIIQICFGCLGEMGRPFQDGMLYYRTKGKKNKTFWSGVLGVLIAIPLLCMVAALLGSADALFRNYTDKWFDFIMPANLFNIIFRILFLFFASYMLTAYLCKREVSETVTDKRKGEPILAIIVTGLLSVMYLMFSGIQIFGLFLGRMQLPEGYTYAMYAREGFFQLLTVSILNLIIVLISLSYFRKSNVLRVILTAMSLCTFIMIASSAMRMIIYIRYYYLTFLRIFVLWALLILLFLFVGVIINIFRESFGLFRYGVTVVTVLYLLFSFSHPDYIIAKVNVANAPHALAAEDAEREMQDDFGYGADFFSGPFFLGEYYTDYDYLSTLSADAAPVLIPYMKELGYDLSVIKKDNIFDENNWSENRRWRLAGFGKYYLMEIKPDIEDMTWRTFNISRYMASRQIEKALHE